MAQPVYVNFLRIGGQPLTIDKDDGRIERISFENLWKLLYKTETEPQKDIKVAQLLEQYEKEWDITIPSVLKTVTCWTDIRGAIFDGTFPTNNILLVPGSACGFRRNSVVRWHLVKENVVASIPDVTHMARFMDENQGCCYWYAAWNDNDEQCKVYVSPNILPEQNGSYNHEEPWSAPLLTSDDLLTFLIDYTREGESSGMNDVMLSTPLVN